MTAAITLLVGLALGGLVGFGLGHDYARLGALRERPGHSLPPRWRRVEVPGGGYTTTVQDSGATVRRGAG